jgi:hypothetical protein
MTIIHALYLVAAVIVGIELLKLVSRVISGLITVALFAGAAYAAYKYGLPILHAKGWI